MTHKKNEYSLTKKQRILIILFILLLTILFVAWQGGRDAKIRVAWDSIIHPDFMGYKVYWGRTSKNYEKSIKIGKVNTYTLKGLIPGQTYYIAVTAYYGKSGESSPSKEVSGVAHSFLWDIWNSANLKWEAIRSSLE